LQLWQAEEEAMQPINEMSAGCAKLTHAAGVLEGKAM
jgi:hypothetical protein